MPSMPCPFCATERPDVVTRLDVTVTDSATPGKVDYTIICERHGEHTYRAVRAKVDA